MKWYIPLIFLLLLPLTQAFVLSPKDDFISYGDSCKTYFVEGGNNLTIEKYGYIYTRNGLSFNSNELLTTTYNGRSVLVCVTMPYTMADNYNAYITISDKLQSETINIIMNPQKGDSNINGNIWTMVLWAAPKEVGGRIITITVGGIVIVLAGIIGILIVLKLLKVI